MEEIKVGEYVRTRDGYIAKIKHIEYAEIDKGHKVLDWCEFDEPIYYEYGEGYYNLYDEEEFKEKILKHSPNIIDLIEVGDYVNGDRMDVVERDENGKVYYLTNLEVPCVKEKDIKSIVTKEQFENMEYRLENYPMNEEDIKILEEFEMFCEDMYYFVDDDMGGHFKAVIGDQKANTMLGYFKLKRILENLINRNKELVKENEILKKDFTDLCKLKNVIPKSKVKEKIEELTESMNKAKPFDISYIEYCEDRIEVLQELLKE